MNMVNRKMIYISGGHMEKVINEKNIDRFSGFSQVYNSSRPIPPDIIIKSALIYANKDPQIVVDIGSGTGLSTQIWKDAAQTVIGIEPNDDMRCEAEKNVIADNISFQKGVSNDTGLPGDHVDIVSISQSFHWFDIDSTLEEIFRILKDGGVLAIYDCDFPPSVDWIVEKTYCALKDKSDGICFSQENPPTRNDKDSYMKRINSFGKFRFVKEIVCHNTENCTPDRMIGIALSQGSIKDALQIDASFQADVDEFCDLVKLRLRDDQKIIFSYRLRLAVK